MSDTILAWGDLKKARLINKLAQIIDPNNVRRIPLIVDMAPEIAKGLGMDINVYGVNKYGEPGGMFIRIEPRAEDILPRILLSNGDEVYFILTDFYGGPTVFTDHMEALRIANQSLMGQRDILKAQVMTLQFELENATNQMITYMRNYRNLVSVSKEGISMQEDDQNEIDMEKAGAKSS